ncbi:MAG TPA: hypothetical protein VHX44_11555 [Planctomycetota bacterium]|nr:hypothetical protein [Planctomycetota bacterium]
MLREANAYHDKLPDDVAQRIASAQADLEAATAAVLQANEAAHAQLTSAR